MKSQKPKRISGLVEYVKQVIMASYKYNRPYGSLWFRGVSTLEYDLVPSLVYRKIDDESSLVGDFRVALPAYVSRVPTNPWELYSLMQHHGLPTRLLDWTKSPLAALYFALDSKAAGKRGDPIPVVWVVDPEKMNMALHGSQKIFIPGNSAGYSEDAALLSSYLPHSLRNEDATKSELPEQPIAVEPPFTNPRIRAQQGCFTVHGTNKDGLNALKKLKNILTRIEIEPSKVVQIRAELEVFGVLGESIYQDLDRLAKRIVIERTQDT